MIQQYGSECKGGREGGKWGRRKGALARRAMAGRKGGAGGRLGRRQDGGISMNSKKLTNMVKIGKN